MLSTNHAAYLMLDFGQDFHQLLQGLVPGPQLHGTDGKGRGVKAAGGRPSPPHAPRTVVHPLRWGSRAPASLPLETRLSRPRRSPPLRLLCNFGISPNSSELNAAEREKKGITLITVRQDVRHLLRLPGRTQRPLPGFTGFRCVACLGLPNSERSPDGKGLGTSGGRERRLGFVV